MPIPLVAPRPLRRLVAALLALSVLLTMLGGAHPACADMAGQPEAGGTSTGHAAMSDVHTHAGAPRHASAHVASDVRAHVTGGDTEGGVAHCRDHDRHHAPDGGGCALVAHCVAAAIPVGSDVAAPTWVAAKGPAVPDAGRPLERPHQPESPPPKA